jgi:hypothetical protein
MLNKNKNIFIKRNCLSKEELISYAKQTLPEIENHHVEKHLLDCELCTDALDGIYLLKDPSGIKNVSAEMLRRLHEKNPDSKKNSIRPAFLIAAAIVCVFIISGIYFSYIHNAENLKSELAVLPLENKKINDASQPILFKDTDRISLNESTGNSSVGEAKIKTPEKVNSQSKDALRPVTTIVSDSAINVKEFAAAVAKPADEIINGNVAANEKPTVEISSDAEQRYSPAEGNSKTYEYNKRVNDSEGAKTYSNQEKLQKPEAAAMSETALKKNKSGSEKKNIDDSLKEVQKDIENENYKSASISIGELSKEYPENMNVKYLSGVVYYKTNEGKKALDCFNAVLNSGDKNLFEDARLHKALTYVKMSDNKNARIILNQIIADKSRYTDRAWEIIEQIDGN